MVVFSASVPLFRPCLKTILFDLSLVLSCWGNYLQFFNDALYNCAIMITQFTIRMTQLQKTKLVINKILDKLS